jgi:23S rRNA (cytidine1920-2'-O)/16S rRNA (cytidine1409-2'-O)-methyltransferase
VVRDPELRTAAVASVADAAAERGWGARAVVTSPLPGPSGNLEYFLWIRRGAAVIGTDDVAAEVRRTAAAGVADERVDQ